MFDRNVSQDFDQHVLAFLAPDREDIRGGAQLETNAPWRRATSRAAKRSASRSDADGWAFARNRSSSESRICHSVSSAIDSAVFSMSRASGVRPAWRPGPHHGSLFNEGRWLPIALTVRDGTE